VGVNRSGDCHFTGACRLYNPNSSSNQGRRRRCAGGINGHANTAHHANCLAYSNVGANGSAAGNSDPSAFTNTIANVLHFTRTYRNWRF
jgi:hypothetical protein